MTEDVTYWFSKIWANFTSNMAVPIGLFHLSAWTIIQFTIIGGNLPKHISSRSLRNNGNH